MAETRVITMGCRLNAFESEVIRRHARTAGLNDAIVVNTCAVTREAERQARQTIRRTRRDNPGARIIATGCAAQLNPSGFAAMDEVDQVLGNEEKLMLSSFMAGAPAAAVNDIMSVRETARHLIGGFGGRTRAFLQVQQGCDHRCTFCVIPFARGNNRSLPMGALVNQVRDLVDRGFAEVVLTGVDICSYGGDLPGAPTLGRLVRRLLKQAPELRRLRLSSLDPAAVDEDLFGALANEERLMPHLHLSLQAMDDMVLKRMKRRHSRGDAFRVIERARALRPDTVFGADLIAGFPTETDAMFENTLSSVDDLGLTHLHVFPYSERDGTPAARMPAVPGPVRKQRARLIRERGEARLAGFMADQVGARATVLIEKDGAGLTDHYAPLKLDREMEPGALVAATVTGVEDGVMTGRVLGR